MMNQVYLLFIEFNCYLFSSIITYIVDHMCKTDMIWISILTLIHTHIILFRGLIFFIFNYCVLLLTHGG